MDEKLRLLRNILRNFGRHGPRAFMLALIIFSMLALVTIVPLASATPGAYYAKARLARTSGVMGTQAFMQTIDNTVVSDVCKSVVIRFPDLTWIGMGYLEGNELPGYPTPTYYCEWWIGGISHEEYYGTATNLQWHTYAVQYSRNTQYTWFGLLDTLIKRQQTGFSYSTGTAYTQGESHNTDSYMTEDVDNMKYALASGRYYVAWYDWDGYASGYPHADSPYVIVAADNTHVNWNR